MAENRSKDFRYVFTNAFGVRYGDNDVTLTLGITEGGSADDMLEEMAVIMTPRTLKILVNNLNNLIQKVESEQGEIFVPPGKLAASFEEMVESEKTGVEKTEK